MCLVATSAIFVWLVLAGQTGAAQGGRCLVPGLSTECVPSCDPGTTFCVCSGEGATPQCVLPADVAHVILEGARLGSRTAPSPAPPYSSTPSSPLAPSVPPRSSSQDRIVQRPFSQAWAPSVPQCLVRAADRRSSVIGVGSLTVDLTNGCSFALTCQVDFPGVESGTPFRLSRGERSAGGVAGATLGTSRDYEGPAPSSSPRVECHPTCDQGAGFVDSGLACGCSRSLGLEEAWVDGQTVCVEHCPSDYYRTTALVCERS